MRTRHEEAGGVDGGDSMHGEEMMGQETKEITPAMRDRARGVLLGQFVGDALGTTVEFSSAAAIAKRYPEGLREIQGGGPFNVLPGQVTDDGELALALARTLAEHGWDLDARAAAYAAWRSSGPFDVGGATNAAFGGFGAKPTAAAMLAQAQQANGVENKQANGALMRISPAAIFGAFLSPAALAERAREDARLSHPSSVCQAANVAGAVAAQALLHGASREEAWASAKAAAAGVAGGQPVVAALDDVEKQPVCDGRGQGWVLLALRNAFHFLLHEQDFEEALVRTVMAGGDADTNGCIAGALLGAACGIERIPARWVVKVLACRTTRGAAYQTTDALSLADRLLERGFAESRSGEASRSAVDPVVRGARTAEAIEIAQANGGKVSPHRTEPARRMVIKVPLDALEAKREVQQRLRVEPIRGQLYWVFDAEKPEAAPRPAVPVAAQRGEGEVRTSQSHPLRVDWLLGQDSKGRVGLTIAPGKHSTSKYSGGRWERDLAADLDLLVGKHGAQVLVCLLEDGDLARLKIPDLVERAEERGLEVIRFPIRDLSVVEDKAKVLELVKAMREHTLAGKNVVVHCEGGLGRAGTIGGCYLALLGHRGEKILDLLARSRSPKCPETEAQRQYVRDFAEMVRAGKVRGT